MKARHIRWAALALLLVATGPLRAAEKPIDQFRRGLEKYAQGDYQEALKSLDAIEATPKDAWYPEWLYDRAAALFKVGKTDEARELWVRAASLRDAAFEARCRYNLGNCDYRQALDALNSGDVGRALELLRRARENYLDAVRLDPDLLDARANLELATQLEKRLKESTPPSSQPATQPNPSDSQGSNSSRQQSPQQQSQQDQRSEQGKSQVQPSDQQQSDRQNPPPNQPPSATQPAPDQHKQAPSQRPDEAPNKPQPPPEHSPQPEERSAQQREAQPVPVRLTKEQAERLLQLIRDAEKRRREALQAREAARYKPVERDW